MPTDTVRKRHHAPARNQWDSGLFSVKSLAEANTEALISLQDMPSPTVALFMHFPEKAI